MPFPPNHPLNKVPKNDWRYEGIRALEDIYDAIIALTQSGFSLGSIGTEFNVGITASSTILIPANPDRVIVRISNNTNQVMWVSETATATVGQGTPMSRGDVLEINQYNGVITVIWVNTAGGGDASATEITP